MIVAEKDASNDHNDFGLTKVVCVLGGGGDDIGSFICR